MTKRDPTTEVHRPPQKEPTSRARAVLLSTFPMPLGLELPRPGEIVGRAWLAAAGLIDKEISGQHLSFSRTGGQIWVEDCHSRNGTFINGQRLSPGQCAQLNDGDLLRAGRTLFVFRAAFEDTLTPAPALGRLVGPFGLNGVRRELTRLSSYPERNVLLLGETGTGKELLAAAVIQAIARSKKPVARVNVAGVPAALFEAQLFGWRKGAYSGSVESGPGILRAHDKGSVFLDEIGELPMELQPKLLRLIENSEVQPVGEPRTYSVDIAIIAATNRDIDEMVEEGKFRRDLLARFYARIELPSLVERREDLFAIASALRERRNAPIDVEAAEVEAVERLMLHTWPANIRDLDRVLAMINPMGPLTLSAVERALGPTAAKAPPLISREAAEAMLRECKENQSEAARRLGISRPRLRRLLGLCS